MSGTLKIFVMSDWVIKVSATPSAGREKAQTHQESQPLYQDELLLIKYGEYGDSVVIAVSRLKDSECDIAEFKLYDCLFGSCFPQEGNKQLVSDLRSLLAKNDWELVVEDD